MRVGELPDIYHGKVDTFTRRCVVSYAAVRSKLRGVLQLFVQRGPQPANRTMPEL